MLGPGVATRETKVRTVVDGVAALDKYTTGGVNFKSMTSSPPQASQPRAPATAGRAHD